MIHAAVYAVNSKFKRKGCDTLQVQKRKPAPYKNTECEAARVFSHVRLFQRG